MILDDGRINQQTEQDVINFYKFYSSYSSHIYDKSRSYKDGEFGSRRQKRDPKVNVQAKTQFGCRSGSFVRFNPQRRCLRSCANFHPPTDLLAHLQT